MQIGFIGTGIMGRSMAGHLLAAGHTLHVFNRTRAKAEPLVEQGALWHDTPGDVAAASDVVITMVGLPGDVEEVYFGGTAGVPEGQGIIDQARAGTPFIDMTTSSPMLAERIAAAAAAPVPAGAGQRCKLANQVAVAIGMVAWCEALAHAQAGSTPRPCSR